MRNCQRRILPADSTIAIVRISIGFSWAERVTTVMDAWRLAHYSFCRACQSVRVGRRRAASRRIASLPSGPRSQVPAPCIGSRPGNERLLQRPELLAHFLQLPVRMLRGNQRSEEAEHHPHRRQLTGRDAA